MSWPRRLVVALVCAVIAAAALVYWLNVQGEAPIEAQSAAPEFSTQQVQRGAYLARAGNCAACHTDRGGQPFAGGKGITTPFGIVYASNLTPDLKTGIGDWTAAQFWRAMHHGRSKDGRLLYPAFPYPSLTLVTRDDSDALFAFLRSQTPVAQPNRPHDLKFPYNLQASLAVWRALFFVPDSFVADSAQSPAWNRGAYLVRGLGHCDACHAARNLLGATRDALELSGGLIQMQNWYAPSLAASGEAGVADWPTDDVIALLKSGKSTRGAVMGPMAEVVFRSTQHLTDADLAAMATYLKSLPLHEPPPPKSIKPDADALALGGQIYQSHCAQCHGADGRGLGPYPSLVGHRTATMGSHVNLVRVILGGGFPPTTKGNPRPYGMPSLLLIDEEVAAVASYVRSSWGNAAPAVRPVDVTRLHGPNR